MKIMKCITHGLLTTNYSNKQNKKCVFMNLYKFNEKTLKGNKINVHINCIQINS